jgi:hypothetical protein
MRMLRRRRRGLVASWKKVLFCFFLGKQ